MLSFDEMILIFKNDIIERLPISGDTRQILGGHDLSDVLDTYLEFAFRHPVKRPREVLYLDGFWDKMEAIQYAGGVFEIAGCVTRGEDLGRYLSRRAHSETYVRSERGRSRWENRDFALNAFGVHHLHIGTTGGRSRYSDQLLFVRFLRNEAVFLFVGDHKSFDSGELSEAASRFNLMAGKVLVGISPGSPGYAHRDQTRLARYGLSGLASVGEKVVIGAELMSDGSSLYIRRHSDRIMVVMSDVFSKLSIRSEYESWYGSEAHRLPESPKFRFVMDHMDLCLYEETSQTLLRITEFRS